MCVRESQTERSLPVPSFGVAAEQWRKAELCRSTLVQGSDGRTQIASAYKLPRVWYAVAAGETATTATKGKGAHQRHKRLMMNTAGAEPGYLFWQGPGVTRCLLSA